MNTKAMDVPGEEKAQESVTQHMFSLVLLPVASEKGTHLIFVLPRYVYSMVMPLALLSTLCVL